MGKIILVTGGSRSGKSSFAEKLANEIKDPVLYIATAIPFDGEMQQRIQKHQEQRPNHWGTYEGYEELGEVLNKTDKRYKAVLLDCVTLWLTNMMFKVLPMEDYEHVPKDAFREMEHRLSEEVAYFLEVARAKEGTCILVTNEIGQGLVPETKMGRVFRDLQGRVNQQIGQSADEVYLVVCGVPMKIK